MSKIGRNDPCPCGSGKKYKKCCGQHDRNYARNNAVNQELYQAHQGLISFTTTKYDTKIQEQYERIGQPSNLDNEAKEIYRTGVTPWIVSSVPCLKNDETILKRYYRTTQKQLSPHAREILVRWLNVKPSVYEVISINTPEKNLVKITELGTNDSYFIPFQNENDFSEGCILIGSLVPFVNHHDFLLTMVKLFECDIPAYTQFVQDYRKEHGEIDQSFPDFLAEMLYYEPEETPQTSQDNSPHDEVAHLLAKHLKAKKIDDETIQKGINYWNTFCEKEHPTIKKTDPYAAAMDYYIQKVIIKSSQVKQTDIAKEYETSASTLSNIYRRFINAL